MDLGLQGKRALVMGGGRGIGRGIADGLAAEGARLALVSRNQAALDVAAEEIAQRHGQKVLALAADLADRASLERAVAQLTQDWGGVDILVNNSGGPPPSGAAGVSPDIWRTQFESLVLNIIGLTDMVLPGMRQRRWGRILTVASSGVVQPIPTIGISNSLRSALVGWSKTLAGEVGGDGVTVNMLLPGRIDTARIRALDEAAAARQGISTADIIARSKAEIPLGRYGSIAEIGAVATFLASEPASYVTGSLIRIDGGLIRSI